MAKSRQMHKVGISYFKWPLVCLVYNTPDSWTSPHAQAPGAVRLLLTIWNPPTWACSQTFFPSLKLTSLLISLPIQTLSVSLPPWGGKWPDLLIYIIHTKVWMVKRLNSLWSCLHSKRGVIGGLRQSCFVWGWQRRKGSFPLLLSPNKEE